MTIDIIDLTDPQYSGFNPAQLKLVREAQRKKNAILAKSESDILALLYHLIENRNARTSARKRREAQIRAQAEEEIDLVREKLLEAVAYEALGGDGNEYGPYRYPQNPNYNLSYSERFLVVREYYMNATSNAEARLKAYEMDDVAREYLGEYYITLYEHLKSYIK